MTYNTNKIYTRKLTAISENDALNIKNNKDYKIFENENNYFMIMDNKIDGYAIYSSILCFFKEKDLEVDVDLDSFLTFCEDKKQYRLLMSLLSAFNFVSKTPWSMKTTKVTTPKFNIYGTKLEALGPIIKEILVVSDTQTFVRKLQDMPSNLIYPATFVEEIIELFKDNNNDKIRISVYDNDELKNKGMNLLTGVGQGAHDLDHQAKLMVIEYKNSDSAKHYGYVGKGVCFDNGGNNIKTGPNMRWMKFDMSGAAIVAGSVYALSKNNIKTNVTAIMPLVLNLTSASAQRPDDVLTSYSGKTVEIDNTDAEGRLILADALTYANKDLGCTDLYDVATLTGAMIYSLGDTFSGVWSTSNDMWKNVLKCAQDGGEQVWRLPFHAEFLALLKSNVADIVNSCTGPKAGSSRAACFLKEFIGDSNYTHFDVAATADKGNVGTGIILKTLYNVAKTQN